MNSIKGLITLMGGMCFMMGALATATEVADEVNSKDKASAGAEVILVAKAPELADARQSAKAPLVAGVTAGPTLTDLWDKNKCFVVLSGNCL